MIDIRYSRRMIAIVITIAMAVAFMADRIMYGIVSKYLEKKLLFYLYPYQYREMAAAIVPTIEGTTNGACTAVDRRAPFHLKCPFEARLADTITRLTLTSAMVSAESDQYVPDSRHDATRATTSNRLECAKRCAANMCDVFYPLRRWSIASASALSQRTLCVEASIIAMRLRRTTRTHL